MKIYNTLSTKVDELHVNNNNIKIYLCGVTVYDESHIGHARTIIIFDVLHRYLLSKHITVTFIQNFTDIDDKIIKKLTLSIKTTKKYLKNTLSNIWRMHLN